MNSRGFCPNCGAPMEQDRFSTVCMYCGTVLTSKSSKNIQQEYPETDDSRKHYDYITANEERIVLCRFVKLEKKNNWYIITSKPFCANDGFLKQIPSPHWVLQFQCNSQTDKILLGIYGNRPALRMSVMISEGKDIIDLPKVHYANGITWFLISEAQLLAICTSRAIDLSTDLTLPTNAHFNELPIFAARFYNSAFNRMKFMYSTHVNLISDTQYE